MSDPITRQRSAWRPAPDWADEVAGLTATDVTAWRRRVGDGELAVLIDELPRGWHLSISFHDHKGRPSRYPTWDEILHAREELLPADLGFVMHLPVGSEYVALHPTTFHLHEHPER